MDVYESILLAEKKFTRQSFSFISFSCSIRLVGWLVVLRINVDLAIFQPHLDLEAGANQSLKIQVARPGIEPRSSCSASQELNHSATAAPVFVWLGTCDLTFNEERYTKLRHKTDEEAVGSLTSSIQNFFLFLLICHQSNCVLHYCRME